MFTNALTNSKHFKVKPEAFILEVMNRKGKKSCFLLYDHCSKIIIYSKVEKFSHNAGMVGKDDNADMAKLKTSTFIANKKAILLVWNREKKETMSSDFDD